MVRPFCHNCLAVVSVDSRTTCSLAACVVTVKSSSSHHSSRKMVQGGRGGGSYCRTNITVVLGAGPVPPGGLRPSPAHSSRSWDPHIKVLLAWDTFDKILERLGSVE